MKINRRNDHLYRTRFQYSICFTDTQSFSQNPAVFFNMDATKKSAAVTEGNTDILPFLRLSIKCHTKCVTSSFSKTQKENVTCSTKAETRALFCV